MRVIIDGDAAFVAADDFVNPQESEVAWIDVPATTLADFRRRDRNHRLREAASHIDGPSWLSSARKWTFRQERHGFKPEDLELVEKTT